MIVSASLAVGIALSAASAVQTPDVIVERITTVNERQVRVTLFSNQMAVTTVCENGEQVFVRRLQLDDEEYIGYLGAVNRDAEAVAHPEDRFVGGDMGEDVVLRVRLADGELVERRYRASALLDLALARFSATLDDLEHRLGEVQPGAEELRAWTPRKGDVVELVSGGRATVMEVRDDGLIALEHQDVAIIEMVPPERLADVVLKVVGGR